VAAIAIGNKERVILDGWHSSEEFSDLKIFSLQLNVFHEDYLDI
jgi:hypothetical protein